MPQYRFVITAENLVSVKMAEAGESIKVFEATASKATKEVTEHFELMGERMTETFKNLKGLLLSGLGIAAIFEGWELIEHSKEKFEGLEKSIVKVQTVLKSTKFAAGFSATDIENQSKELSKHIVNQRDEILNAQGALLANTNIKGNTFEKALQAAADYSTFKGTDLTQGAFMIGRALQDPLQGMNQIRRMYIILSAQQKEHIKNYEKQGDLVKAQGVILDEIQKRYGGQAEAYAGTDAGKIQLASKAFTELQYQIGDIISRVEVSLIPSFIKVVNAITSAFNSSVIQFFIEHLKDLVSIVLKLLPIWIAYKAVMFAVDGITSVFSVSNGILTASMGGLTIMTDGATVAMEGFDAALASTGIGLLVVGIGLLIEKLISVNSEFEASIQKITRLDELTNKGNPLIKETDDAWTQYVYGKLDSKQKGLLYNSTKGREEAEKNAITESTGQLEADKVKLAALKKQLSQTPQYLGDSENQTPNQEYYKLSDTIDELSSQINKTGGLTYNLKQSFDTNNKITNDIAKQNADIIAFNKKNPHHKKALIIDPSINPATGIQATSTNTSNLSGASGGLGQAREIHLTIGVVQQNNGVKESKDHAAEAAEYILRILNNANSQSAQ